MDRYTLLKPFMLRLDPEMAHKLTLLSLRFGLGPVEREPDDPCLACALWGQKLPNPIGIAAGFDKDAEAVDALLAMGFGFVEAGTVTPLPQPGNPRPRVFRLPAQQALINRYGFNSKGLDAFAARMAARRGRPGLVGANVGKNKDAPDAAADFAAGIAALTPTAGYLVINVSSPNTPGLRALQGREPLLALLRQALAARAAAASAARLHSVPPLLLKVAPDLTEADRQDIADVALELGLDGLIVSNTTLTRPPEIPPALAAEAGGLSGRPLRDLATAVLADFARRTEGKIPLIGVGGITCGADAYARIRAGASLIQLYTALVYGGTPLLRSLKRDLAACLKADGFRSVAEAVGTGL